jgi:hypothetical protein
MSIEQLFGATPRHHGIYVVAIVGADGAVA